jgi:hypothetical protein
MLKKLQYLLLGFGIAIGLDWAWAQTPTIFNNIQVNQQSDLRGNVLNSTGTLTLADTVSVTGKLSTAASALGGAGLNLPAGTAPTSPVDGDVWTTTAGLFARINGGTVGPFSAGGSPGGMDTYVQFNDSGAFGGDAGLVYAKASQILQITNLNIARSGLSFLTLNNTGASANQKKTVFHTENGFAGFCQLSDAESDPSVVCDVGHASRSPFSWTNTGTNIDFTLMYGDGVDIESLSGGLTFDSGGTNIALSSNGELDLVASTFISTGNSLLKTRASNAIQGAGLNLPHGTAPGTPSNGDLWTTTAGLFARINGATVGPYGAGSSPGGSNTQVQFNDSSAFGGDAGLTYDKATDKLTVAGAVIAGVGTVNDASFQFSGDANTGMFNLGADHLALTAGGFSYVDITGASSRVDLIANTSASQIRLQAPSTVTIWAATLNGGTSGNVDMTPESGSFTVNYDTGCTTTPSQTVTWKRQGNVVTMSGTADFTCTNDAVAFQDTSNPMPTSIRPAGNRFVYGVPVNRNSVLTNNSCFEVFTTGTFSIRPVTAAADLNCNGSFGSSGTAGLPSWTIAYPL